MSTLIRPELSETNRYWIEKHRYYELKHFCLQYPLWRHAYNSLIDYPGSWPQLVPPCKTNVVSDPVTKHIDERLYYADRMKMVEQVAKETDEDISCYIFGSYNGGYFIRPFESQNRHPMLQGCLLRLVQTVFLAT